MNYEVDCPSGMVKSKCKKMLSLNFVKYRQNMYTLSRYEYNLSWLGRAKRTKEIWTDFRLAANHDQTSLGCNSSVRRRICFSSGIEGNSWAHMCVVVFWVYVTFSDISAILWLKKVLQTRNFDLLSDRKSYRLEIDRRSGTNWKLWFFSLPSLP